MALYDVKDSSYTCNPLLKTPVWDESGVLFLLELREARRVDGPKDHQAKPELTA